MPRPAIAVEGLRFEYPGVLALEDVSFEVARGSVTALVGPNGAGKTTLLRCLAGLERPMLGMLRVAEVNVLEEPRLAHRKVGFLPDFYGLYDALSVRQCLMHAAAANGVAPAELAATAQRTAQRLDIHARLDSRAGELSRGQRQRVAIAQALAHAPEVLLLDEPASGLDPKARVEIRALLRELVRMGKTILISSHILEDIADLCNRIGLIERGRLVVEGALDEVMRRVQKFRRVVVRATPISETAVARLRAHPSVQELAAQDGVLILTLAADCRDITFVPRTLLEEGAAIAGMDEHAPTLEEAFLNLTKGEVS